MSMRNFWIESDIEGRSTMLSGGPRAKVGEMSTNLFVKSNGCSVKALSITCRPNDDNLMVTTRLFNGDTIKILVDNDNKGELLLQDHINNEILGIVEDKTITPTQRLKAIKELLK